MEQQEILQIEALVKLISIMSEEEAQEYLPTFPSETILSILTYLNKEIDNEK